MSFNKITHPTTGVQYSIFSNQGRELLKNYLRTYKSGGSLSNIRKKVDVLKLFEKKIEKYERLYKKCLKELDETPPSGMTSNPNYCNLKACIKLGPGRGGNEMNNQCGKSWNTRPPKYVPCGRNCRD